MTRRAIDIAAALIGGVIALPIALTVALTVRLAIGTPILFVQQRSGRDGKAFRLVKFRSMTDARDNAGRLLDDAARTPTFGHWLRRTRLDELPELLNILRGDMSVIGPRPLLPSSIAAMGARGVARGAVRPGLTGWAQVNGNALLSDGEKCALDLWYIGHATPGLDLVIVGRTIGVMLFGERVDPAQLEKAFAGDHRRRG